jgi:predicted nucleic acid-binding protein
MGMATELETIETEIAEVRAVMAAIASGGQSVSIGDMTYTEANYSALAARERELSRRKSRLDLSRPRILPVDFSGFQR